MKIIVFTTHAAVLPIIDYFHSQGWLHLVVTTEKIAGNNLQIEDVCIHRGIEYLKINRSQLLSTVQDRLLAIQPDLIIMMGFSYLIPKEILTIPPLGFYNIHFSLLPAYKGSDPIFWQLKNGETMGGITIHHVDEHFDTGEIVLQQEIPFIPGENWGICNGRYVLPAFAMIKTLLDKLILNIPFPESASVNREASYLPIPVSDDMLIQWDSDTAAQVEQLVNACNPLAGGAVTLFRQQIVRIMEVSPVDGKGEPGIAGGTVIHADGSGLFVQCADQKIIRINVLKLTEGFMSGFKLVALGVVKGDRFEHLQSENLITIS